MRRLCDVYNSPKVCFHWWTLLHEATFLFCLMSSRLEIIRNIYDNDNNGNLTTSREKFASGKPEDCFPVMRFFTYVCSIRVNERVYVFWALRTYTYVKKKTHYWKTVFSQNIEIGKEDQFSPLSSTRRGVAYHKKKRYFSFWEELDCGLQKFTVLRGWQVGV